MYVLAGRNLAGQLRGREGDRVLQPHHPDRPGLRRRSLQVSLSLPRAVVHIAKPFCCSSKVCDTLVSSFACVSRFLAFHFWLDCGRKIAKIWVPRCIDSVFWVSGMCFACLTSLPARLRVWEFVCVLSYSLVGLDDVFHPPLLPSNLAPLL